MEIRNWEFCKIKNGFRFPALPETERVLPRAFSDTERRTPKNGQWQS